MLFSVNTNNNSLNAQKALMRTSVGLNKSVQKLSSALNSSYAGDDAAGVGMSENLKSGVYRSTGRNNGIAATAMLGDNANSALQTVSNTLLRMRELAAQSTTPSLTTDLAHGAIDSFREVLTQDPSASLRAQANQSPDRAETLLRD